MVHRRSGFSPTCRVKTRPTRHGGCVLNYGNLNNLRSKLNRVAVVEATTLCCEATEPSCGVDWPDSRGFSYPNYNPADRRDTVASPRPARRPFIPLLTPSIHFFMRLASPTRVNFPHESSSTIIILR